MILVDEAVAQYADSVGRFGASPKRSRQPDNNAELVDKLDASMPGGLRVPGDLRDFWTDWNPSTFGLVLGDGISTIERSWSEWQGSSLPSILLLICSMDHQSIYVELGCSQHPGSRLYLVEAGSRVVHLWGIGVVGLLNLVGDVYKVTGADPAGPCRAWVDPEVFRHLASSVSALIVSTEQERRIDLDRPDRWPEHWRRASDLHTHGLG